MYIYIYIHYYCGAGAAAPLSHGATAHDCALVHDRTARGRAKRPKAKSQKQAGVEKTFYSLAARLGDRGATKQQRRPWK